MGVLDFIKSLVKGPSHVTDGDTLEIPAHLLGTGRVAPTSIRFSIEVPGARLVVTTPDQQHFIETYAFAKGDAAAFKGSEPLAELGGFQSSLSCSLDEAATNAPWFSSDAAEAFCKLTLEFYVNEHDEAAAMKLFQEACVQAGLISEDSTT